MDPAVHAGSDPGRARASPPPSGDRSARRRYGVAFVALALAFLMALSIDAMLNVRITLLLVIPVAISAWYGGRGPGVLTSLLCLPAIVFLYSRGGQAALDVRGLGETLYLGTFLVVALIIGTTAESLRRAQAQAIERAERLEELASRTMQVQQATAALANARTESEVADVVLAQGLSAVGATRGFLARVERDAIEIVRASGYEPETAARVIGKAVEFPAFAKAVETGKPVWIRSVEEHRAAYQRVYDRAGITDVPHASVAIPLRHGDETVGALGLFFVAPAMVNPATEAFSLMLGQAAADALSRARSYDSEREARQRAETLAQARADVLGVVAHDLRNPLNRIASTASLLLELGDLSDSQKRKLLEVAQRAVRRMGRLIGDLLDATRLQAGRLTLELRDLDARTIIRDSVEMLRPVAEEKRIVLRAQLPEIESIVRGDEARLLQVMDNLVGNALKFTGEGGQVAVSARAEGTEIVFRVADNGPGIPSEQLNHLFDRFWQARDADQRGVGLGLAIVKGIVEAHGGRIWVESTVGKGCTFQFAIPVSDRTTASADARVPSSPSADIIQAPLAASSDVGADM